MWPPTNMANQTYTYQQIGIARTPFDEKSERLDNPDSLMKLGVVLKSMIHSTSQTFFKGPETFSHIWLLFIFT